MEGPPHRTSGRSASRGRPGRRRTGGLAKGLFLRLLADTQGGGEETQGVQEGLEGGLGGAVLEKFSEGLLSGTVDSGSAQSQPLFSEHLHAFGPSHETESLRGLNRQ
jgi:hypothetical protein